MAGTISTGYLDLYCISIWTYNGYGVGKQFRHRIQPPTDRGWRYRDTQAVEGWWENQTQAVRESIQFDEKGKKRAVYHNWLKPYLGTQKLKWAKAGHWNPSSSASFIVQQGPVEDQFAEWVTFYKHFQIKNKNKKKAWMCGRKIWKLVTNILVY